MIKTQNNQKACPTVFRGSELRRGFTLLETLVAISVVTLTIVGPLAMAAQSAKLISVAKNQLIATYLAQEAMEIVRYIKDTNMIMSANNVDTSLDYHWLRGGPYSVDGDGNPTDGYGQGGLTYCLDSYENSCYVTSSLGIRPCSISEDPDARCQDDTVSGITDPLQNKAFLWKHATLGYVVKYGIPAGEELTQTSFRRYIQIIPILNSDAEEVGAKVIVKVVWKDSYGEKTLYTQENIYKYR